MDINNSDSESDEQNFDDIFDFVTARNDIFRELFASITKIGILHSIPDEGIDELLKALLCASNKSNSVFKKKLKQAIELENSKSHSILTSFY